MDFKQLFDTQAKLDAAIYEKHPEIKGQDNLDWKVLALQVELGELANEWRGFKKWSNDQEPRTNEKIECFTCNGTGDENYEFVQEAAEGNGSHEYCQCETCDGTGYDGERNPLLEEYADCLGFILTIGLEISIEVDPKQLKGTRNKSITRHFTELMIGAGVLTFPESDRTKQYHSILGEFLMLGIELGFDYEQIEGAYYDKNKINHERQEAGY